MIELQKVDKIYSSGSDEVHALKDVNLKIDSGENVVIIGKSGSGKSTLLNVISGIDRPTKGNVTVADTELQGLKETDLAQWRGLNIGIVFQFYQLIPTLSVIDNVLFPMNLVNKIPKKERRPNALIYLEEVGLSHKANKFPNQLSGGERQRVAIARAMANEPDIIIADEPTGNLDSKTGAQIDDLFKKLNEKGTTLLTVTHAAIAHKKYDRILRVEDGVIEEEKNQAL